MFVLQCLFFVLVSLYIQYLWARRRFYLLSFKLPCVFGYPFLGNLLMLRNFDDVFKILKKIQNNDEKCTMLWLGPTGYLMVSNPEIAEAVLTSPKCLNKADIYENMRIALGDNLLTLPSATWKFHKRMLSPAFKQSVISTFYPIMNSEVDKLLRKLDLMVDKGAFDLDFVIKQSIFGISSQTTMGSTMLKPHISREFVTIIDELAILVSHVIFQPWRQMEVRLFKDTKFSKKFMSGKMFVYNMVDKFIEDKALSGFAEPEKHLSSIFIEKALDCYRNGTLTSQELADESVIITVAATETSAATLLYCLICLAMFPHYQEMLHEELCSIFPEKNVQPTSSDIRELTFTERFINETLRLFPPIGTVARTVGEDLQLPNGIVLPKGLQVAMDIYNMHRNENIWGPEAELFNPDNFLPENVAKRNPYTYIPFLKGVRSCVGMRYGMVVIKLALAKIVRNYRLSTTAKFEDLHAVFGMVLKLKNNPLLEVHRRE